MSELRVKPSEVHDSGVEIGEIAAAVQSAFNASDTEIASAQSGWVGASGSALATLSTEWQQTTRAVLVGLIGHADKFVDAAQGYYRGDGALAASVRSAAENIAPGAER